MGGYGRQREQTPLAPFEARDAPFPADPDIYRALSLTNRYEGVAAFTPAQDFVLFPLRGAKDRQGRRTPRIRPVASPASLKAPAGL